METVKNCGPFGCKEVISINHEATSELRAKQPLGRFSGLEIYLDRGHLAISEVNAAWSLAIACRNFSADWGTYLSTELWALPLPSRLW